MGDDPLDLYVSSDLPTPLSEAIWSQALSFFVGAGASIPSGVGGWRDHYLPLLTDISADHCSAATVLCRKSRNCFQLIQTTPRACSISFATASG